MAIAKILWTPDALRIRRVAVTVAAAIVSAVSTARAQQAPAARIDDLVRQAVERFAQTPESAPAPATAGQQAAAGSTVSLTRNLNSLPQMKYGQLSWSRQVRTMSSPIPPTASI